MMVSIQSKRSAVGTNGLQMFLIVAVLAMPVIALGQAQQNRTLVVSGSGAEAPIKQINGVNYVDLEALARITRGTLSFQENRVLLTLPAPSVPTPPSAVSNSGSPEQTGFSKEFRMTALEAVSSLREWVSTLAVALQNGYPIGDAMASYRARATDSLRLATVAASTTADRRALQLLNREFDHAQRLSSQLVSARNSLSAANYSMAPETIGNDPAFQQIVSCGQSLGGMLASGDLDGDTPCR